MDRYNTSKLLNILWLRELSSKVGLDVIVNGVNPGLCASTLHRSDTTPGVNTFNKIFAWTSAQGGHNLVDAAIQHSESQGGYISEQTTKEYVALIPFHMPVMTCWMLTNLFFQAVSFCLVTTGQTGTNQGLE